MFFRVLALVVLAAAAGCAPGVDPGRGRRDAGATDASIGDAAGSVDASGSGDAAPDASAVDAAPTHDSGAFDAGPSDAGSSDAGARDTGPGDAGPRDVGTDAACPSGQTLCGGRCVDTRSDVANCGMCGRTCDLAGATEACVASTCVIAACDPSRGDCDMTLGNGCETTCSAGSACTTSCMSTGTRACASVCAPTCTPPAEACNLVDDDCDGACDESVSGCRVAVHRAYRASDTSHFYTTSLAEAGSSGHVVETASYFFLRASGGSGLVPFFRCLLADGRHFYTTSSVCEGAAGSVNEGALGEIMTSAGCGAVPLFRVASVDHLYTISAAERDAAVAGGAVDEGVVGFVRTAP